MQVSEPVPEYMVRLLGCMRKGIIDGALRCPRSIFACERLGELDRESCLFGRRTEGPPWSSTSMPRRRSAAPCRPGYLCSWTRSSNEAAHRSRAPSLFPTAWADPTMVPGVDLANRVPVCFETAGRGFSSPDGGRSHELTTFGWTRLTVTKQR
jgi:hypothetical protein